jgi:hypothetical protein
MPTPFLCESCLLRGTSYAESGKGITFKPEDGEQARFFHLDIPPFRVQYHLEDKRVCDLLVEYRQRLSSRPMNLFTELKGGDLGDAQQQIATAFGVLTEDLKACQDGVEFRALVVASTASPGRHQTLQRQLHKLGFAGVWVKNGVKRGHRVDIRQYVT